MEYIKEIFKKENMDTGRPLMERILSAEPKKRRYITYQLASLKKRPTKSVSCLIGQKDHHDTWSL